MKERKTEQNRKGYKDQPCFMEKRYRYCGTGWDKNIDWADWVDSIQCSMYTHIIYAC